MSSKGSTTRKLGAGAPVGDAELQPAGELIVGDGVEVAGVRLLLGGHHHRRGPRRPGLAVEAGPDLDRALAGRVPEQADPAEAAVDAQLVGDAVAGEQRGELVALVGHRLERVIVDVLGGRRLVTRGEHQRAHE
jgi:hypothetical protein